MNSSTERAVSAQRLLRFPVFACITIFLIGLSHRAAQANGAADTGRTETLSLATQLVRPFKHGETKRHIVVYLPAGYGDSANSARRYPVVYLLHGSPGNPLNFLNFGQFPERMEKAVQAGEMQSVIFVMPDGNYAGERHGDGEWADSADRRDRFETWITKEIVPFIDSHYRTRAEPAGRYDMRGFGWGHIVFNDSDALMALNSPLYYVPDRVAAGRVPPEWKSLKIFLGAGAEETPYADHTRRLGDALRAAGVQNVIVDTPEGKHDWNLWAGLFFKAMTTFLPASPPKG